MLVDLNVRHDTRLDADFCASITEHGVLVPIVAVRATDGALRVRYGHRRTLAAVQTGRPTVPVVIAADETCDDAATVERLVTQWAENEHRVGLTTAERADVIGQLSAFGVTPTQIARRTRATKIEVTAALAVHGSELTRTPAGRPRTPRPSLRRRLARVCLPRLVDSATITDDAPAIIELDDRRRVSLGKIGRNSRYVAREEADGTIVLEPAMVLTEAEARLMGHSELLATIEDNRAHPERRRPRPDRPTS